MPRSRQSRERTLKLTILLVSTLLALTLAEVAARIAFPELGWRPRPDADLGWSTVEYQRFDPTRDRDAARRILFLGDSFLAGSGVDSLDERFPVVLEGLLDDGTAVEILAGGGWGTDQQLMAFVQKGRAWDPDVVVLAFCPTNDVANNLSNGYGPGMRKPYFVLGDGSDEPDLMSSTGEPLPGIAPEASQRPPLFQSGLVDLIRYRLHVGSKPDADDERFADVDPRYLMFARRDERDQEIYDLRPELSWSPQSTVNHASGFIREDYPLNAYGWRLTDAILERMKREVETGGAKLVVMLVPASFSPQDERFIAGADFSFTFSTPDGPLTFASSEPSVRLAAITDRLGIELYDPSAEFIARIRREGSVREVWPMPDNRHFFARGHAMLAEQLAELFRNRP